MKRVFLAIGLMFAAPAALADGFVLGSGRWSCKDVIGAYEQGSPIQKGQLAGWLLGYWTAATFQRSDAFVDIVEKAGGQKIYEATVTECRNAPPDTLLFRVADSMIRNTK